jgi:hypothetical protein
MRKKRNKRWSGLYVGLVMPSQGQVGRALTQGMPPHSKGVLAQLTIDFLTAFFVYGRERETIPEMM